MSDYPAYDSEKNYSDYKQSLELDPAALLKKITAIEIRLGIIDEQLKALWQLSEQMLRDKMDALIGEDLIRRQIYTILLRLKDLDQLNDGWNGWALKWSSSSASIARPLSAGYKLKQVADLLALVRVAIMSSGNTYPNAT